MKCHNIVSPGGLIARVVRRVVKGSPLYGEIGSFESEGVGQVEVELTVNEASGPRKIRKLFDKLEPYGELISVYLHGSWADRSTTEFSDIDDFVVLENKQMSDAQLRKIIGILNNIDMQFCRIDPLQHHGHWLTCRSELENYDNSYIPLFILEESHLLVGNNKIRATIDVVATMEGLRVNVHNTAENIIRLSSKLFSGLITVYELKELVGSFVLMPALIFQLKGLEIDKPDAISRAAEVYSNVSIDLLEWSTDCRNNWSVVTSSLKYKLFSLLPYFLTNPHLWRKFSKKYSPGIRPAELSRLTDINIDESLVERFISETLSHVE